MRYYLVLIFIIGLNNLLLSQISVSGKVFEYEQEPASFATVSLLRSSDSLTIKNELTDENGNYIFQNLTSGVYFIKVKSISNSNKTSSEFSCTEGQVKLPDISLNSNITTLKEVEIKSSKPVYERKADRIIYNLENSLESPSSDMLDVLQKAPLVNVDANGNLSLRGKQGVVVMINGKPSYLGPMELANLLRSTSAGQVAKIELITNPPAKYDAAGNAGIINIVMKKSQKEGFNGNILVSAGQSRYPRTTEGLNMNYRNSDFNIYGAYNYGYHEFFNDLSLIRRFYINDVYNGAYDQKNYLVYKLNFHNLKLGLDYYLGAKTIIGIAANTNKNSFDKTGFNTSNVFDSTSNKVSYFTTSNTSPDNRANASLNFNIKHTIDSIGKEITMDLDYAEYSNKTNQNFITNYYNLNNLPLQSPYLLFGDLQGKLKIKSIKIDYSHPINKNINLEMGLKFSEVDNDNNVKFFDQSDHQNIYDSTKSNHFIYSENINAAYLNSIFKLGEFNIQAGLRVEQTNAKGNQLVTGESFERHYTQLFPSVSISKKIGNDNEFGLTLSKRIDRPSYEQLNPFKYFLDPSTYKVGNPYLFPQLTYAVVISHTYRQEISTAIEYNRTSDNIINVLIPEIGKEKTTIQTDKNIANYEYYGINTTIPFHPFKWWTNTNIAYIYYSYYSGNLEGATLNDGAPTFSFDSNNSFILKNSWNAELNFSYKAKEVYGFMTVEPIWTLSAAIQKQFWNKKASIRLNLNDIFFTGQIKALTVFTDYKENFLVKRSSQLASISFSYRFGKNTVPPSRKRSTGVEDEKRRVGNNSNS